MWKSGVADERHALVWSGLRSAVLAGSPDCHRQKRAGPETLQPQRSLGQFMKTILILEIWKGSVDDKLGECWVS
jgi:hypothetical protein